MNNGFVLETDSNIYDSQAITNQNDWLSNGFWLCQGFFFDNEIKYFVSTANVVEKYTTFEICRKIVPEISTRYIYLHERYPNKDFRYMPRKPKYHENLPVQSWMQTIIQELMDQQYSLEFLNNSVLKRFLDKFAFDHHTSGIVLFLVILSYIWTAFLIYYLYWHVTRILLIILLTLKLSFSYKHSGLSGIWIKCF